MKKVFLWLKDAQGATAIEYGLLVAGISVVIAVGVFMTGNSILTGFQVIANAIGGAG